MVVKGHELFRYCTEYWTHLRHASYHYLIDKTPEKLGYCEAGAWLHITCWISKLVTPIFATFI